VTLFIILHATICIFLVGVILLQPGKGDAGVGFGSSSQSIFGSKGAGNFLTRTTSVFAFAFLLTSFVLTRSRLKESNPDSVISNTEQAAPVTPTESKEAPKAEAPKAAEKKK